MRFVPWLWGESISRNYFKSNESLPLAGFHGRDIGREREPSRSLSTKSISFPAEQTLRLLKWFKDGFASREPTWAGGARRRGGARRKDSGPRSLPPGWAAETPAMRRELSAFPRHYQ
jgi:hypothetical protein